MEKKKISPLRAIIIMVEMQERKKKILIQSLISVLLICPIYPIAGHFLNFPSLLTAIGSVLVGIIVGKIGSFRSEKLDKEIKEFWKSHEIDISLEK